jgi:hypothetical protein
MPEVFDIQGPEDGQSAKMSTLRAVHRAAMSVMDCAEMMLHHEDPEHKILLLAGAELEAHAESIADNPRAVAILGRSAGWMFVLGGKPWSALKVIDDALSRSSGAEQEFIDELNDCRAKAVLSIRGLL